MSKRTDGLTNINTVISMLERKASDFEWEGNTGMADDYRKVLDHYYELREQGELYVPDF